MSAAAVTEPGTVSHAMFGNPVPPLLRFLEKTGME